MYFSPAAKPTGLVETKSFFLSSNNIDISFKTAQTSLVPMISSSLSISASGASTVHRVLLAVHTVRDLDLLIPAAVR